MQTHI